jgi:hypothetical protein
MKRTVHHTPTGYSYTSEPIAAEPKQKTKTKKQVSIATLDRRLQVIRTWQREGLITAAKAKALTAEVLEAHRILLPARRRKRLRQARR